MVSILSPDIPTKFAGKSKLDTGHNQYIVFDATSAAKDVIFHFLFKYKRFEENYLTPKPWIKANKFHLSFI
jgi:hypothetical protein